MTRNANSPRRSQPTDRIPTADERRAQERYYETANNPPADSRPTRLRDTPPTHTTGGAKDHAQAREGDGQSRAAR